MTHKLRTFLHIYEIWKKPLNISISQLISRNFDGLHFSFKSHTPSHAPNMSPFALQITPAVLVYKCLCVRTTIAKAEYQLLIGPAEWNQVENHFEITEQNLYDIFCNRKVYKKRTPTDNNNNNQCCIKTKWVEKLQLCSNDKR